MQHFTLKGQTRKVGNKAVIKAFRKEGLVPCNLYGNGVEPKLFTVSAKDLQSVINTPVSYILDLVLDNGKPQTAVLHELQFHPVSDICLHVDFLAVNETKPIAIEVPVYVSGHPVGVQKGGKFVQNLRKLRISALMKDLPDDIKLDVSNLDLDKKISAGDVKVDNVKVLTDKDSVICTVRATRNSSSAAASTEGEAPAEGEAAAE